MKWPFSRSLIRCQTENHLIFFFLLFIFPPEYLSDLSPTFFIWLCPPFKASLSSHHSEEAFSNSPVPPLYRPIKSSSVTKCWNISITVLWGQRKAQLFLTPVQFLIYDGLSVNIYSGGDWNRLSPASPSLLWSYHLLPGYNNRLDYHCSLSRSSCSPHYG